MLLAAAPAAAQPDPVSAFGCRTRALVTDQNLQMVADAYHRHSVTILKMALAGDLDRLRDMVDPSAKFEILLSDDHGVGWDETGASAAVTFARAVGPTSYEFSTAPSGIALADPCRETSAELMLTGRWPDERVVATFRYRRGLLVGAVARLVDLTRGDFGSAADR
ncbi:MAG TPA: hypothetical protein VFW19_07310 [Allosphingosinicella sp.]|nr:hypothetical protein [Allosphingosinicella sp.]